MNKLGFAGEYALTVTRKGQVVAERQFKNTVVTEGKVLALNVLIGAETKPSFSCWLMSGTTDPTIDVTDTYLAHPGWTDFSGQTAASVSAANTSSQTIETGQLSFTVTAGGTIAGASIRTASKLWSAGKFIAITVENGDTVTVKYKLSVS